MQGKLFVIPTPIGNLEDITLRALNTLKEVDVILAEDTRQTGKLLQHYQINTPTQSYHQHNEHKVYTNLVNHILSGKTYGLVSDAGTPGISDPGYLLIRECIANKIEVICLPGATAFVPALVKSGIPCDSFLYLGFLPEKKGRQTAIKNLAQTEITTVIYESPHRLLKTLAQLKEHCTEERKISVSREISKMFEQTVNGTIAEVENHFLNNPIKGEFVIVIEGKK